MNLLNCLVGNQCRKVEWLSKIPYSGTEVGSVKNGLNPPTNLSPVFTKFGFPSSDDEFNDDGLSRNGFNFSVLPLGIDSGFKDGLTLSGLSESIGFLAFNPSGQENTG